MSKRSVDIWHQSTPKRVGHSLLRNIILPISAGTIAWFASFCENEKISATPNSFSASASDITHGTHKKITEIMEQKGATEEGIAHIGGGVGH